MKSRISLIILLILLLPLSAFSQSKASAVKSSSPKIPDELQVKKMAVGDVNKNGKLESADLPQKDGDLAVAGDVEAGGRIKANTGLCIGDNCKKQWPRLKCAEYDNRPRGETGDTYCESQNKTCFAASIGSGTGFFNECSTLPASTHRTRCCWVE